MAKSRYLCLAAVLIGFLSFTAAAVGQPTGAELTKLAEQGESVFNEKCAGCHTIGAEDQPTGPSLAGITERRERQWLINFITNPDKMITAGDETAVALLAEYNNFKMPAMPLDPAKMEALLVYLAHPEEASHHADATQSALPVADPARGAALFSGALSMEKGGAPCLACHGIAGVGLAGNSNYGPDLTTVYENFGADGLAGILQSLPFPSMEAIYANHPLTKNEQHDLAAYFEQTAKLSATPSDGKLAFQVIIGVVILLGLTFLVGLRRIRATRQPLIDSQRNVINKGGPQ